MYDDVCVWSTLYDGNLRSSGIHAICLGHYHASMSILSRTRLELLIIMKPITTGLLSESGCYQEWKHQCCIREDLMAV
jgi:hypothetical protein